MLLLAIPVVLAELGWVTMGLVDTLMVGGLGPEAIGAVGIGTSVFMGVCIFAMGLLLGLERWCRSRSAPAGWTSVTPGSFTASSSALSLPFRSR